MLDEFKKFILKGNVVDLSTGVIIGAAFWWSTASGQFDDLERHGRSVVEDDDR